MRIENCPNCGSLDHDNTKSIYVCNACGYEYTPKDIKLTHKFIQKQLKEQFSRVLKTQRGTYMANGITDFKSSDDIAESARYRLKIVFPDATILDSGVMLAGKETFCYVEFMLE